MPEKLFIGNIKYHHPTLGYVTVVTGRSYKRVSGRWTKGLPRFSMPPMTEKSIYEMVNKLAEEMLRHRPSAIDFTPGKVIEAPGVRIEYHNSGTNDLRVKTSFDGSSRPIMVKISYGSAIDITKPESQKFLSKITLEACESVWPVVVLPRAKEIANHLGKNVISWQLGRGTRTLGTCSVNGEITLSRALVLLPLELRDYVICHELAHLTELNHSPRFHAIVDKYLVGREAELEAKLKKFPWPILR